MPPLGLLALAALAFAVVSVAIAAACRRLGWTDVSFSHGSMLSVQTTALNKHFVRLGRQHKRPMQAFFNLAPPVAAALAAAAACLLLREAWVALRFWYQLVEGWLVRPADGFDSAAFAAAQGASHFALAVPGITIPWAHAGYLWIAAAVSLCVHECGHALAAAAEGVTLHHVALFLVLAMPGAYVALDSEGLAALTPWRVLRIVCAGVWLNGLLCLMCWLAALLLPALLLPLYATGQGAVIWSVPQHSALHDYLQPGDAITDVNGCAVASADALRACIYSQDASQQMLAPALQPLKVDKVLTGDRLTRHDAARQSGIDADSLFPDDLLPDVGTVASAVPPLAEPQRGYCVPDRTAQAAEACLLDMRQLRGSACAANELCFAGAHHDLGAASLQGAMELLTADADVERHVLRVADDAEVGGRVTGVCLRARSVAAGSPCDSHSNSCPPGTKCLAPLLHYGAHMFKMSYRPGHQHVAPPVGPAAESTVTAGRRLLAARGPEQHRKEHKRRQQQPTQQQQQGGSSGAARVASLQDALLKGRFINARHQEDAWRTDVSGQLQPWVVDDGAAADTSSEHEDPSSDLMPASRPEAAAARTTQQQQQPAAQQPGMAEQQQQQPFLVWVGAAAEAAAAFEASSYLPRGGLAPLWLPAALERLAAFTFAVSAAIAVLNMLPLTLLDGGQALQAALAMSKWEVGPLEVAGLAITTRCTVRAWSVRVCTVLVVFVLTSHALRLVL